MASLRISCSPEEVEEIFRRVQRVLHLGNLSKPYPTNENSNKHYYLQVYTYRQDSLLDQLDEATKALEKLTLENDRLKQVICKLRQRLGEDGEPQPWDVVLGGKTK